MEMRKENRNGLEVWVVRHPDGKEHSVHMSEAGARTALLKNPDKPKPSFYDAVSKKDKGGK